MKNTEYKKIYYEEYTFIFKFEENTDEMLHIWVRHTTEPKDAIKSFIEGKTTWNKKHERFETSNQTHTIFWFWIDEEKKIIMIITCFKN